MFSSTSRNLTLTIEFHFLPQNHCVENEHLADGGSVIEIVNASAPSHGLPADLQCRCRRRP